MPPEDAPTNSNTSRDGTRSCFDQRTIEFMMDATKRAIWSRLDALQYGEDVPVVVIEQRPIGYGGQLSFRILGLRIGLVLGRKAVFQFDSDPPYVQSLVRPFSWDIGRLAAADPPVEFFENDERPVVVFQYFRSQEHLTIEG